MATGKKTNEELKASKLFDVSGFTAVVTGGGTGIGLSACPHALLDQSQITGSSIEEPQCREYSSQLSRQMILTWDGR